MHTSLDGFVGGPNGEMDWIDVDDEMFEYAGQRTREADTALYGRVTYQMMESYWPTAGDQPTATKHDIEHSKWYNSVAKVVVSRTMKGEMPTTHEGRWGRCDRRNHQAETGRGQGHRDLFIGCRLPSLRAQT
jgi:dihydrofolate reductase